MGKPFDKALDTACFSVWWLNFFLNTDKLALVHATLGDGRFVNRPFSEIGRNW